MTLSSLARRDTSAASDSNAPGALPRTRRAPSLESTIAHSSLARVEKSHTSSRHSATTTSHIGEVSSRSACGRTAWYYAFDISIHRDIGVRLAADGVAGGSFTRYEALPLLSLCR